jgi:exonuclease VII small subunit
MEESIMVQRYTKDESLVLTRLLLENGVIPSDGDEEMKKKEKDRITEDMCEWTAIQILRRVEKHLRTLSTRSTRSGANEIVMDHYAEEIDLAIRLLTEKIVRLEREKVALIDACQNWENGMENMKFMNAQISQEVLELRRDLDSAVTHPARLKPEPEFEDES